MGNYLTDVPFEKKTLHFRLGEPSDDLKHPSDTQTAIVGSYPLVMTNSLPRKDPPCY